MSDRKHTFHIPVMGTAFTIDSPIKIARFGITSVISIGDDELCEEMRAYYSKLHKKPYQFIERYSALYRSRRIESYLNLVKEIVDEQISEMKTMSFDQANDLNKYFEMLPDDLELKHKYQAMLIEKNQSVKKEMQAYLKSQITPGGIEVNIMTKVDKINYSKTGEQLPDSESDASAALKGYAESNLESGIVFSAGFNRRLYAYMENFKDFYPDKNGNIKKKVIMKVSDVRSSLTQGKFLAKKGIWISEHRIESGLNCGGHAFASDGYLLGPILQEFKDRKEELSTMFVDICNEALEKKGLQRFNKAPSVEITVQGGIGTALEDKFLRDYYKVEGTGWASPFLLVPEASTLDLPTREMLSKTTSDDLFLSDYSPLGIPFNTVRNTASSEQREERIKSGRPGSPCPKQFLISNTEFTKKPICTASVAFQRQKIKQLKEANLSEEDYNEQFIKATNKTCLCEDLAAGALIINDIENKRPLKSAVCPGPNLAYFSTISSLKDMVGHIYGRINLLNSTYRPNFFISELKMYIDYLKKEIKKSLPSPTDKQLNYLNLFKNNLNDGINYYKDLIPKLVDETKKYQETMRTELNDLANEVEHLFESHGLTLDSTLA